MLPLESTATPVGSYNWAAVAGPPSPPKPPYGGKPGPKIGIVPVGGAPPATVAITPFVETLRTRLLEESAMYRLPAESTATALGLYRLALVAGPPSPREVPPPATVVMIPLDTLRMR